MAYKGETWNESEVYRDALTLRPVRKVTRDGLYNQSPTYHTNIGFTADGEFLIFGSAREHRSAIFRCHVPTGDITQLVEGVPGTGGYGELHKGNGVVPGNGLGVTGNMCIAPRSRWAAFVAGRALRAVQIETLEERILVADLGAEVVPGVLSVDLTETYVLLSLMRAHPEILAGRRPTRPYMEHFAQGGMELRIVQVPLSGGSPQTVYQEPGVGGAHSPHCPTDPDLLLIDRDFPPRFWGGSDGVHNRIWTLRLSTGALTELPSRDGGKFQVHSAWTWDGQAVVYHGRSAQGGYFIGVADRQGQTIQEYHFAQAEHYGHVSAMAGRPAIILDGNLTNDTLLWLYYDQPQPRVEIIARHNSEWGALPGQYTHPHPISDPTGRWIAFNAGQKGRSGRTDLYIVQV